MQPTPDAPPPAAPAEPAAVSGLVDLFTNDRQRGGMLLLGACTVFLLLALFCAWQATRGPRDADPAPKADAPKLDEPEKPKDPHRGAYILAAVTAGAACLQLASVGAWLIVSLAPPELEKRRTQARAAVLAAGSGLGTIFMVAGLLFFYRWSGSLTEWLDRGQTKEAKFVLVPFLAILLGASLTFFALFPARAEERNNPLLRRWVYGMNLKLVVLLAFLALLLVNLIVGPRLPNRLDTTEMGFYSLSPNTIQLLQKLPEPITAHVILQGGRVSDDVRRLAANCADVSGGKFSAKVVNPTSDQVEYQKLVGKYPVLEANEFGVLLTVGADGKRHSFLREDEFSQRGDPRNREAGTAFVGEARLLKELLFLAENEQKAVVYFTQSSGESALSESGDEPAPAKFAVQRLREYLGRSNLDVRPLRFDPKDPKVPDNAAVVAVIEPRQPMRDEYVAALRRYMADPRPGGQKGKLIVLAGATLGPAPKYEVTRTGLEPLLAEYGVRLEARMVVGESTRELTPFHTIAGFAPSARRAKNPIALTLGEKTAYRAPLWREVGAAQPPGAPPGAPAPRAAPLLITVPGRYTWLEDRALEVPELGRALSELERSGAAQAAKRFTDESRAVGVTVADGDSGRLVVIGNGSMVSDAAAEQGGGDAPGYELFGAAVDWLRDRPVLSFDVQSKKYQEFRFPATADENRGLWLPLIIGVVAVLGLGSAVWVVRRRTA